MSQTSPRRAALRSGCVVIDPLQRLLRFFDEEHSYYDGVVSLHPNKIDPIDVLATVAVNSFVNDAAKVRRIHRGLAAACDPHLEGIPPDAALNDPDPPLDAIESLLGAAVSVRGVLLPVATKVLHRKRPALIPMLDTVVINHYADALALHALRSQKEDGSKAATVGRTVLEAFRHDLLGLGEELTLLRVALTEAGYPVTEVRILEVLLWTQVEPRGYYRAG